MPDVNWLSLVLFVALVLSVSLYGLTASGHFPRAHAHERSHPDPGAAILWGSMAVVLAATVYALAYAAQSLPWQVAVIAGGGALLIAPLLLQPLPDSFVDGRRGLITFAAASACLAAVAWHLSA